MAENSANPIRNSMYNGETERKIGEIELELGKTVKKINGNEPDKDGNVNIEVTGGLTEQQKQDIATAKTEASTAKQQVEGVLDEIETLQTNRFDIVNIYEAGAKGDGITDDYAVIQSILNTSRSVYVPNKTFKINSALNVPPNVELIFADGAVFDMTSLTTGNGFTTRVGSKFENVHLKYSSTFTGVGWYFTTIDNLSATSVSNADSNRYIVENVTIEQVMPKTGVAWDWYTNATGTAFMIDAQDNPDSTITSGFWGALVDNLIIKGVWLQAGLIQDDAVAWMTSSTIRRVTIDGARRGFQINSAATSAPKTGALTLHDFHMQGWRWTKSGQPDVVTEWMLKVDCSIYCDFKGWFPQDFSGTMLIQNFIQFGANSKKCSFESPYIIADTDIQDLGTNNKFITPLGTKFSNTLSTNTKTLDWYEEGTFTVNVIGSTTAGTCTYSTRNGTFTRVGNTVNISLEVAWTGHTGTGNLRIGTMPYTSNATNAPAVMNVFTSLLTYGASGQVVAMLGKGGGTIDIYNITSGSAVTNVAIPASAGMLRITGTYTV